MAATYKFQTFCYSQSQSGMFHFSQRKLLPKIKTMSWKISRFTTSLMGLLRESGQDNSLDARMEDIREAMLDCLSLVLKDQVVRPAVWAKILHATDIEALWYARSGLMAVLSAHLGETPAREQVQQLTELFRGLMSHGHMKPSRF